MRKNKIYWFEGVTEKGVKSLLNDENSKFRFLRAQRNRRFLVAIMAIGIALIAMLSFWSSLKDFFNIGSDEGFMSFSMIAIFIIFSVLVGFSLLRISVRGITEAPNELLDERQIKVRDDSFRFAYYLIGYIVLLLMLMMLLGPDFELFQDQGNDGSFLQIATLFTFSSLPSMVLAWREGDI